MAAIESIIEYDNDSQYSDISDDDDVTLEYSEKMKILHDPTQPAIRRDNILDMIDSEYDIQREREREEYYGSDHYESDDSDDSDEFDGCGEYEFEDLEYDGCEADRDENLVSD